MDENTYLSLIVIDIISLLDWSAYKFLSDFVTSKKRNFCSFLIILFDSKNILDILA